MYFLKRNHVELCTFVLCMFVFVSKSDGSCSVDSWSSILQLDEEIDQTCQQVTVKHNVISRISPNVLIGRDAMTSLEFGSGVIEVVEEGCFQGSSLQSLKIENNLLTDVPLLQVSKFSLEITHFYKNLYFSHF